MKEYYDWDDECYEKVTHNNKPELTDRQLQDAVEERETAKIDIPGIETIKIKRQIQMSAIRCMVCGTWECPDFDHERYDAVIIGETTGLCESCKKAIKKAILWVEEHMNDSN